MEPDTRSSARFLWWVLRQWPVLMGFAAATGALWMLPTAVMPLMIGRALDTGIAPNDGRALLIWLLALLALGLVQAANGGGLEWTSHSLWIHTTATTQRVVLRHVTTLGATVTRKVRAGEIVAIGSSDIYRVGNVFEIFGRAVGAVLSFLVAAALVLSISPIMGAIVLVGVPLATVGIGPLVRPLRRRDEVRRERFGELTAKASDIVSGLRILRGLGGEAHFHRQFVESSQRVRTAGIAVGRVDAWLAGAEILLPGLVTVLVTWLGARLALAGTISVGDLVAFYGVSAFLVIPVRIATETVNTVASGLVAAGRACALLRLEPALARPASPRPLPAGALSLRDEASGLEALAGRLTVIDANGGGEELTERLTHHAEQPHSRVFAGGVALDRVAPEELRRRIVLAHHQDLLFSGPPRAEIDMGTGVDVDTALHAADAYDVLDALPAGSVLDERARSLSGGQRQRLLLARALCSDADVLVLDEPTSAVDAHTEARIVERVRELRSGRTTVVRTESPLWTRVADSVQVYEGRPG